VSAVPPGFWAQPFAHRGLHDGGAGRPENSLAAFDAAIAHGYAIELDVQASADGEAMVFHDYAMKRLTGQEGRINAHSAAELRAIGLTGGGTIPDLETVLRRIDGRAPVLVEIKDQSGAFGETDGVLERRVCAVVRGCAHPESCAIMSFNPYSVLAAKTHAPAIARGLVSYDFEHPHDAHVEAGHRRALAEMAMLERCDAGFVSYGVENLSTPPVEKLRERGVPVICWTVRSAAQAHGVRGLCDQITFEGYLP